MNMAEMVEIWRTGKIHLEEKLELAKRIIRYQYPEFSCVGKPPRQLLAIAGSIVKKWEYENYAKVEVFDPKSSDTVVNP